MCTTCTYQTTVCCMRYISANDCTSLGPFFSRTKHSPAGSRIESTALGTRRPESLPPTHLHAVRRSIKAIDKGFHLKQAVVGAGIESHTLPTAHCAWFDQGNGRKVSMKEAVVWRGTQSHAEPTDGDEKYPSFAMQKTSSK